MQVGPGVDIRCGKLALLLADKPVGSRSAARTSSGLHAGTQSFGCTPFIWSDNALVQIDGIEDFPNAVGPRVVDIAGTTPEPTATAIA